MRHLYSIVLVLVALASSHLATAQIIPNVTTTDDNTFSCSGTATAAPTGGAGGYTYLWSTGATTSSISNLCAGSYSVMIMDAIQDSVYYSFTITNPCSNIALSVSVTNVTTPGNCDGAIQANVTGGTGPYIFSVSGGPQTGQSQFSNLCAGTYTVTVVDPNGCMASAPATITDPCSNMTLSASATNTTAPGSCDGTVQIAVNGGSAPYTFTFDGGPQTALNVTNVCAGTHTITAMDGNGCTDSTSVTVNDPCANMTLSASVTDVTVPGTCDGIIQLAVNNGTGPYVFSTSGFSPQSSSTFNGLCIGTYAIVCEDNLGCTATVAATVLDSTYLPPIVVNLTSTDDSTGSCEGSASVSPTGGVGPYYYLWSNGETTSSINNLCPSNYYVLVWNATDTVMVNFIIQNTQSLCSNFTGTVSTTLASGPVNCDGSATLNPVNGMAPYNYLWSNGVTSQTASNLCSGVYTVYCEDANGCNITFTANVFDSLATIGSLSANFSSIDDLTNNCSGSAAVSPTGGTAPYTIAWSDGSNGSSVINLCAGIYSVTVWDAVSDSITVNFIIADSSSTYSNNPYPNGTINDTLYTDLVTNCVIDYTTIDSAALYQAVYSSSTQSLYVTWAVYSPTDTVYISDTLALIGNPGYYNLTISVYCPNKSGNDFFKIEQVVYFDASQVWMSTLGLEEQDLLNQVAVYPNPFNHSISVDNKDGIIQSLKLVDLNGRVLSEMSNLSSGIIEMNSLETLSSGTYFMILSGMNASKTVKVIK